MQTDIDFIKAKKIRQSNHLIESPHAQEFSVHEIKLFEIAIASCTQDDLKLYQSRNNKQITFSNHELAKLLNTSISTISHEIEKTAARIMKKTIHLRKVLEDGTIEFEMINIIPYASYKNGQLKLELNYNIYPYFLEIKNNFTEFQLSYLLAMNSALAIKLYKLLWQYKRIKSRTFEIEELKKQFGLLNKYKKYNDFKKDVVNPSIFQINTKTDLEVKYNEIKIGRKVVKIEFIFKITGNYNKIIDVLPISENNKLNELNNEQLSSNSLSIINLSQNQSLISPTSDNLLQTISTKISPITKQILNTFYKDKGEQYILASIEYAEENAKTNFDKYLQDTLKNGWCIAKLNKIQQKAEQETKNIQLEQQKQAKQEEQAMQRNIKQAKIKEDFLNLPIEERTESFSELMTQISKAAPDKINEIVTNQEAYTIAYWAIKNKISYNGTLQLSLKVWLKLQ